MESRDEISTTFKNFAQLSVSVSTSNAAFMPLRSPDKRTFNNRLEGADLDDLGGWKAPKELDQPFPRRVKTRFLILAPLIVPLISCGFLLFIVYPLCLGSYREISELQDHGVSGIAQITAKGIVQGRRIYQCQIKYQYNVDPKYSKYIQHGRTIFPLDQCDSLYLGQSIPIIYGPKRPDYSVETIDNRINLQSRNSAIIPIYIVCFFFLFLSVLIYLPILYRHRREVSLLKWGTPTSGWITGAEVMQTRGGKSVSHLYSFRDGSGKERTGKQKDISPKTAGGENGPTILFNPKNSRHSMLYPTWTARIVESSASTHD